MSRMPSPTARSRRFLHHAVRCCAEWAARLLLLGAAAAPAQPGDCPAPATIQTRLTQIEADARTDAALAAFAQLHQTLLPCADAKRESALLMRWSNYAVNHGQSDAALVSEKLRYQLAVRASLVTDRADAAGRLGILLAERGELDLAERRLLEAAAGMETHGQLPEAAEMYSRLSRLHRRAGDYIGALSDEQRALSLRRRIDPPPNVWRSLLNLAVLYEQLEQSTEARRLYGEALDEAEREGVEVSVARVLNGFAGFLNDFGAEHAPQALAMAQRALQLDRPRGGVARIAGGLLQTGRAQLNLGHLEAAEAALSEGLALAAKMTAPALRTHFQLRMGELALAQGRVDLALARVEAARVAYESQGNKHRLIKVQALLERIHTRRGNALAAAHAGREQFRLRDALLGGRANGRISELLARFELGEERLRNTQLAQAKALAELSARNERRQAQLVGILAAVIAVALLLLGWRHLTVRRLLRQIADSRDLIRAQAEQLQRNHTQLVEHSERLLQHSITDALTGIANRARIMDQLREALDQARVDRPESRVACLLLDIDHFKLVNDRHGHPAGDLALIAVAQSLESALRDSGAVAGRVGGEEFLVMVTGAAAAQVDALAEAVRVALAGNPVVLSDGTVLSLTVSVGVHCAVAGETVEQVYSHADSALYMAKRSGRNCVRVYHSLEPPI